MRYALRIRCIWFLCNDVMVNLTSKGRGGGGRRERPRGEERQIPLCCRLSLLKTVLAVVRVRCEARVLKAWYGCAAPENASVADVYLVSRGQSHARLTEYSSGGLDRTTVLKL